MRWREGRGEGREGIQKEGMARVGVAEPETEILDLPV